MAFASDSICAEASPKAVKYSSGGSHSLQEGMPQVPKAPPISPNVSGCGKGQMNVVFLELSPYSRCPQLTLLCIRPVVPSLGFMVGNFRNHQGCHCASELLSQNLWGWSPGNYSIFKAPQIILKYRQDGEPQLNTSACHMLICIQITGRS